MSATIEAANVLHWRPGFQPRIKNVNAKAAKAMTIVAGFRCADGVVLAADTEITLDGGVGKTYASKIFTLNSDLGCHLAYTGVSDFVAELVDHLQPNLVGKSPVEARAIIKTAYRDFMEEHCTNAPKDEKTWAHILVTIREEKKVHLYQARGRHFREIKEYAVLGIGQDQAESAFKPMYFDWISMQQAEYAMVYALRSVKGFVQGCGGDSELRRIEDVGNWLSELDAIVPQSTKEIEEDFDFLDREIRKVILAFSVLTRDTNDFDGVLSSVSARVTQYRAKRLQEFEERLEQAREVYRKMMEENT
jgi:20S proteasome alpha/beta subunit